MEAVRKEVLHSPPVPESTFHLPPRGITTTCMPSSAPATLRVVAIFEFAKGLLALLAAGSFLWARSLSVIIDRVERHLDFAHPKAAAMLSGLRVGVESHKHLLVAAVLVYATIRFVEAVGLWRDRRWAEWLGAISAMAYLPFEAIGLWRSPSWLAVILLLSTIAVAAILLQRLAVKHRARLAAQRP
jgi:uncharacterized membrane protein (DUF2068 family)